MIFNELIAAIEAGETWRVELLLSGSSIEGGKLSQAHLDKLLSVSVTAQNLTLTERLIRLGGNPSYRNSQTGTPLILEAISSGNVDLVSLLVCSGANVNDRDRHGLTALHLAVDGSVPIVKVLMRAGADPTIKSKLGTTPMDFATDEEEWEILELLQSSIPPMSQSRKRLLRRLEAIMGECYNGNIQNYGHGGIWEGEGRWFDYPTTFVWHNATSHKDDLLWKENPDDDVLMSGSYRFGANLLPVYRNLESVLQYLEEHYGLVIDEDDGETTYDGD
ncbi:MAG TPA: ankyrin repeat domain-containing protein, partial [Armatimonadota bacterium]|nr:ankyrin repeat domain-containing protein [Armatimonadota bacterium]